MQEAGPVSDALRSEKGTRDQFYEVYSYENNILATP